MIHILIDNDPMIQKLWKMEAALSEVELICYSSVLQFYNDAENFDPENTIIYLDNNLGVEKSGEEFGEDIFKLGYENLYLCTGYREPKELPEYFKGMKSKRPEF